MEQLFPDRSLRRLAIAAAFVALGAWQLDASAAEPVAGGGLQAAERKLDNAGCLECHDAKHRLEVADDDGNTRVVAGVDPAKFAKGVHARLRCLDCHTNITDNEAPHRKSASPTPDCAQCHEALWESAKRENRMQDRPRLRTVVQNVEAYRKSFHGRRSEIDPTRANATCHECHDTHEFNVPTDRKSPAYDAWRLMVPARCGEKCHEDQLKLYTGSVHGTEALEHGVAASAVCIDCHAVHEVGSIVRADFKLRAIQECADCHRTNLKTYRDTYHGQVTELGDTYTAKCYDCHGSHDVRRPEDPKSRVHPNNLLETCEQCHNGIKTRQASAGFTSFKPHAHAGDFKRYPEVWITSRVMLALLVGVFAFFWLHCGLWYYREWKDRKEGVPRPRIVTKALNLDEKKHVRRFGWGWRVAHLCFALVTMTLMLTGATALFSESAWAPLVSAIFGGTKHLALVHRVAAVAFIGIFLAHLVWLAFDLLVRRRGAFDWLGPDSLVPTMRDVRECVAMFKWFVGRAPRPALERWAYYEKFDYWAVFWGVGVIGFTGSVLALPDIAARFMPGWVFNVATVVHSFEAFLAVVFPFTVHFFNNHFRPDKLPPPDIVMFTGSLSLEEFRRDHPAQYNRLVASGEIEKLLVEAPSAPMRLGSQILGLVLIGIGFGMLGLMLAGLAASI